MDGKIDTEIINRIQKDNQIYYQINLIGKRIKETKHIDIYKSVYIPTLLQSSESWRLINIKTNMELEIFKPKGIILV